MVWPQEYFKTPKRKDLTTKVSPISNSAIKRLEQNTEVKKIININMELMNATKKCSLMN